MNERGNDGRFVKGAPGGPGRPKKSAASEATRPLTNAELADLAEPTPGAQLYLAARAIEDRQHWLSLIHREFPPEITRRIMQIVEIETLAAEELARRIKGANPCRSCGDASPTPALDAEPSKANPTATTGRAATAEKSTFGSKTTAERGADPRA